MSKNYRAGGREGRPSGRDEWRTPSDLFSALDDEFQFDWDAACTLENCLAPRGSHRDRGVNGLEWWPSGSTVWINPPYSGQGGVRPWLERAVAGKGDSCTAVLLVSADTSTRWWAEVVLQEAAEVRFVTRRLRFLPPHTDKQHYTKRKGGGLTTPSAIVVFRPGVGGPPKHSYIDRDGTPEPTPDA